MEGLVMKASNFCIYKDMIIHFSKKKKTKDMIIQLSSTIEWSNACNWGLSLETEERKMFVMLMKEE